MVFIFAGFLLLAIAGFFVLQNKLKNSLADNLEDIQNLQVPSFSFINPSLNESKNQTFFTCLDNNYSCLLERLKNCSSTKINLINESKEGVELKIIGLENESCLLTLNKGPLGLNCNIPRKDLEDNFNQEIILNLTVLEQKIINYC